MKDGKRYEGWAAIIRAVNTTDAMSATIEEIPYPLIHHITGEIDGWRKRMPDVSVRGMRLDYIFCSQKREVLSSRVVFDGEREPVISDHFGILMEIKE